MSPRPNFLYIGTGKAGSTWLFEALRRHPEIYVAPVKETNYFDLNYARGTHWYYSFFRKAQNQTAIGELAHRYWRQPQIAARIRETLGEVKLIVIFRKPEDYVLSNYLYARRNGRHKGSLEQWFCTVFQQESLRYNTLLAPFVETFGLQQVFVGCFDDLEHQPEAFHEAVCRFLGVSSLALPPEILHQRVNAAAAPRLSPIARWVNHAAKLAKRRGGQRLVASVKSWHLLQRGLYRRLESDERPAIPENLLTSIRAIALPELQQLDAAIGSRFVQRWYS